MMSIDTSRLARFVVAGAVAGLVVFLIVNPSYVRQETSFGGPQGDPYLAGFVLAATLAALIGGFVILADELGSPAKRVALRMLTAAGSGLVVGGIGGVVAQFVFASIASGARVAPLLSIGSVIVARAFGWAIAGAGAGTAVGIALGSVRRVALCAAGGLIGGLIGGLLFDFISMFTFTGSASRFVGFIVIGAAVGAAICFLEDIAKQSWVTIVSGAREGKSYILSKAVTTLGRDELADIPLFGDMSIAKQHAVLRMEGPNVAVQSVGGGALAVNGAPTHYTQLRDSDLINIGPIGMRFHQKSTSQAHAPAAYGQPPFPPPGPAPQATVYGPGQPFPQPAASVPTTGRLSLTVTSGPHAGTGFQFDGGTIKIGREADCQILLAQDGMVSRSHAEIAWIGSQWTIRDLGSTNGTYVSGVRVTQQALNAGDVISVGQTAMRVDSA